jgi:hypothetical protein
MMSTTLISRGRVCHSVLVYMNTSGRAQEQGSIAYIFKHVQWRWELNNFTANGQACPAASS